MFKIFEWVKIENKLRLCTLKNACKTKQLHTIYTSNKKFTQSIHQAQTPTQKLKRKKKSRQTTHVITA